MLEYTCIYCKHSLGQGVLFLRYCSVVNIILWTSLNKPRCESSPCLYSLWQFILHFIMPHKQSEMKTRSTCEHLWVTNNAIGWFDGLSDWFRGRQISLAGCVWVRVTCSRCMRWWDIFRIWNDWFWLLLGLCLCLDAAYADKLHMLVIREQKLFLENVCAFSPITYK